MTTGGYLPPDPLIGNVVSDGKTGAVDRRCTFIDDEQAHQLAYFGRHFADRVGHRGRAFQLCYDYRFNGLLPDVRGTAPALFKALDIQWHPYIGHGRSSQAACVNFLLPFADRPDLLGDWIGGVLGIAAPMMLPVEQPQAGDHRHVAFEYTGPDLRDWLGEAGGGVPKRGAHATAADAAVAFVGADERRELVLIEWKYTEQYRHHRLSKDRKDKRTARYADKLFAPAGPIRDDLGLTLADFLHEPFYQLLRQQMLAWQIERAGMFDRVRVLHLSPAGNRALHAVTAPTLRMIEGVTYTDAFAAYRATLADPAAFVERTIETSFAPLMHDPRAPWMAALAERYPSLCRVAA
jgi:hypothetical protein